jgi:signal transduction histidine kinase
VRTRERERLKTAADVALPFLVALFLFGTVDESPGITETGRIVGMVAAVVQGGALWWRRSHPQIVTAIALAGSYVIWNVAPDGIIPVAGLVAVFTLAANRVPRISLLGLAGLVAVTALNFRTASDEEATFVMVFPFVAWVLGEASRRAVADASRRAVAEERARIARELHDVIAHSVSVIVIQAAAADDVFDEHPDQAREALRSIEGAGREALAELRRLLAAVRPDEDEDERAGEGDPLRPLPGLDRLDELADSMRAAGLDVTVDRAGLDATPLPAGVDLSAFRIVQEALTNTLRHAAASHAGVRLHTVDGLLELDIRDDGRGPAAGGSAAGSGAGRGIAGMRERAAMLGGTLDAGPLPGGGGFRVHARLPLEAPR